MKEILVIAFILGIWLYSMHRFFKIWRDILNFSAETFQRNQYSGPDSFWNSVIEYLRRVRKSSRYPFMASVHRGPDYKTDQNNEVVIANAGLGLPKEQRLIDCSCIKKLSTSQQLEQSGHLLQTPYNQTAVTTGHLTQRLLTPSTTNGSQMDPPCPVCVKCHLNPVQPPVLCSDMALPPVKTPQLPPLACQDMALSPVMTSRLPPLACQDMALSPIMTSRLPPLVCQAMARSPVMTSQHPLVTCQDMTCPPVMAPHNPHVMCQDMRKPPVMTPHHPPVICQGLTQSSQTVPATTQPQSEDVPRAFQVPHDKKPVPLLKKKQSRLFMEDEDNNFNRRCYVNRPRHTIKTKIKNDLSSAKRNPST